jgi:hypothetical protein
LRINPILANFCRKRVKFHAKKYRLSKSLLKRISTRYSAFIWRKRRGAGKIDRWHDKKAETGKKLPVSALLGRSCIEKGTASAAVL